jgi:tripartite-type tricarboxylate transporter receptor subunit TctC
MAHIALDSFFIHNKETLMLFNPHRRAVLAGFTLASLALAAPLAQAQSAWPAKAVKIVVPYGPGGAVDVVTRKMAQKLTEQTG